MFWVSSFKTIKQCPVSKDYPKVIAPIVLILACTGLTFYFHWELQQKTLFPHFFYVPIALAGLWWGKRGVWVAVLLGAIVVVSQLLSGLNTSPIATLDREASSVFLLGTQQSKWTNKPLNVSSNSSLLLKVWEGELDSTCL